MPHVPLPRVLAVPLVVGAAIGQGTAAPTARRADGPREPFPDLGLLLRDDRSRWCNEVWLLGRYHGQNQWSEGGPDDRDAEGYETRRFRFGTQMRLFRDLTLHAQAISGTDFEPGYNGFTELWAGWRFHDACILTIGQQKHRFTHDRNVSSRYLQTLERGLVTNQFGADYTPAITWSGRTERWSWYGGLFANATGRDMGEAFTELDSGHSWLATVTRDLGRARPERTAFLNVSAVQSDANDRATNLDRFHTGLASALILTEGPASWVTEIASGLDGDGDILGITVQPGFFVTDTTQFVLRGQVAVGEQEDDLVAQRRYEREVGLRRGDHYQAGYLGWNWYLAGHRLKLMSGVEYAELDGDHVWTASVSLRLFWGPHSRGPFPMGDTLPGWW